MSWFQDVYWNARTESIQDNLEEKEHSWWAYLSDFKIYYHDLKFCRSVSLPVIFNSMWPHGLRPARLLCPWGFSRQEQWSALQFPFPGDLPDPGVKPRSPALQADSLPSEPHIQIGSQIKKKEKKYSFSAFCLHQEFFKFLETLFCPQSPLTC